jgi:peptidyl-prolyl cis-trans isomerase SurA
MPAGSHLLFRLVRSRRGWSVLAVAATLAAQGAAVQRAVAAPPPARGAVTKSPAGPQATPDAMRIAAVVNGDVITNSDIDNRTRLFALSTGLALAPDVMARLRPQILRQLVDERLRMQEALKRKIVIQDQQIADAIHDIEQRNNMQSGALRAKLASDGVGFRTLIDQIRAQLAWTEVLRQELAERGNITPADIAERQKLLQQTAGQPQYRVGEIFIPIDNPANAADAERFAETVISELRSGAAFPIVAAQFSQTQDALEGGDSGWVQSNQLDPAVVSLVTEMPVGAISNPVRVPGGIQIVQMRGKRVLGRDIGTVLTARQAFLPFSAPLADPRTPTDQQREALSKAREIIKSVNGCDAMEQYAKSNKFDSRPVDPGEITLEAVNPPQFRALLASIPIGKPTEPLVSRDGILVMVVCSREEKNIAVASTEEIQRSLITERVELLSRQAMRDMRRQANIDLRGNGV